MNYGIPKVNISLLLHMLMMIRLVVLMTKKAQVVVLSTLVTSLFHGIVKSKTSLSIVEVEYIATTSYCTQV